MSKASSIMEDSAASKAISEPEAPPRRDAKGRWLRGVSGNPAGRKPGSRNKGPRRRPGDRERAAEWRRLDWQIYFERIKQATPGGADAKLAAALSECTALWLLLHPPAARAGLCCHCGQLLDAPTSSVNSAPIRVEGAWVHWGCVRWFLRARWDAAKAALRGLGLPVEI